MTLGVRGVASGTQSSSVRDTFPVTVPAFTRPGDLILYVLHYQASSASVTASAPSGTWTLRGGDGAGGNSVNSNNALFVWERVATASDAGASITGSLSSAREGVAAVVVLQGATYNNASTLSNKATQSTTVAVSTVTPTAGDCLLLDISTHVDQLNAGSTDLTSTTQTNWLQKVHLNDRAPGSTDQRGLIYVGKRQLSAGAGKSQGGGTRTLNRTSSDMQITLAYEPVIAVQRTKFKSYMSYTAQTQGKTAYNNFHTYIDEVLPSWWRPADSADGSLVLQEAGVTVEDTAFVTTVRNNGDRVWGVLANYYGSGNWDWTDTHTILNSASLRTAHVNALVTLAVDKGYCGIDVDYEQGTDANDRDPFTNFCTELADALHAVGKELSVTLAPKLSEPGTQTRHQIQDWAALGAVADEIHVMLYDYDPDAGPASQSPFPWWEDTVNFATSLIPAHKILLGGPTYGYHWAGSAVVEDLEYQDCESLRISKSATRQYHATDRSPFFTYTEASVTHTVYYEDAESLAERATLIREWGLRGMFLWRLGGEDTALWADVSAALEPLEETVSIELTATRNAYIDGADTDKHVSNDILVKSDVARHGLVEFDVSMLPPGAVLNSATLNLTLVSFFSTSPTGRTYNVNRLTATDWVTTTNANPATGGVTWSHKDYNTVAWSSAGGDYTATGMVPFTVPSVGSSVNIDVESLVNDAIDNRDGILSLLIRDPTGGSNHHGVFGAKGDTDEPILTLNFTTQEVAEAGVAMGVGAANNATITTGGGSSSPNAQSAAATATANNATITTDSGTMVTAGSAGGNGTAYNATITGGDDLGLEAIVPAISPGKDNTLILEIASHRQEVASATPVTSLEAPGWKTWLQHPNHQGGGSERFGTLYVASRQPPSNDSGFELSVDSWEVSETSTNAIVAHDASTRFPVTENTEDTTIGDRSFTHTPVGVPAAVIVFVVSNGTAPSHIGVTYADIPVPLQESAIDTVETGRVDMYVLADQVIPEGAQTVVITGCTSADKFVTVNTVTSTSGIATVDVSGSKGLTESTNPFIELEFDKNSLMYGAMYWGSNVMPPASPQAGQIDQNYRVFDGSQSGITTRRATMEGPGTHQIGWTYTLQDHALVAVALTGHATASVVQSDAKAKKGRYSALFVADGSGSPNEAELGVRAVALGTQSSATRTDFPVTIPSAAVAGDLILFLLHYQASLGSVPGSAPDDGGSWTLRAGGSSSNNNNTLYVWEREAGPLDADTEIQATISSAREGVAAIVVLKGALRNTETPGSVKSTESTTVTVQSVIPTENGCLLLDVSSHFEAIAATAVPTSSTQTDWTEQVELAHDVAGASDRRGLIYVATLPLGGNAGVSSGGGTRTLSTSSSDVQATLAYESVNDAISRPGFEAKHKVAILEGESYNISGWINVEQDMPGGVGVGIRWYDEDLNLVSTSVDLRVPTVSRWESWTSNFTAPPGAVLAAAAVVCGGAPTPGAFVYADEVRLAPEGPWTRVLSADSSDLNITLAYESLTTFVEPLAEFDFAIDWDNDDDWDDDGENVTSRVLRRSSVSVKYGRDQDRALSPVAPGEAGFLLDNRSRDYYPDNLDSPLSGFIKPARQVRIRAFNGANEYILFRGYIDGFDLDPEHSERAVEISCVDALVTLGEAKVTTELFPSIRSGDAIHKVLDAIGWPTESRDIDVGATTFRWWGAEGSAAEIIEEIVGSEGSPALVSISPAGDFIFRDRHHRVLNSTSTTSQATFRDAGTEPLFSELTYDHGWRDIVNQVEFDVTEQNISGVLSDVWSDGETVYSIPANQSIEIQAVAESGFVDAVTPVEDIDYELVQGDVEVTITNTSGVHTVIKLSTTSGGGPAAVTNLKLRGYAVEEGATKRVSLSDPTSIEQYKQRAGTSFESTFASYEDAKAIGRITLAHRAERLPIVTFLVKRKDDDVTRYIHMLDRNLSDRVTVTDEETGLHTEFFIERIEHDISELGRFHSTEFGCEKVPTQPVGAFKLGSGQLDVNVLGRAGMDDPETVFILDSQNILNNNILGN